MDEKDHTLNASYGAYPAILIARFAVHKEYKRNHLGTIMLGRSMSIADKLSEHVGCRFLTVDSKVTIEAIKFYTTFGFKPQKKKQEIVEEVLQGKYNGNDESVYLYFDMWKPHPG